MRAGHPPAVRALGAAAPRVLEALAGPRRPATVVHAGRDAVYLDVDGSCVGVLSSRAVQVPCGVRTRWPVLPAASSGAASYGGWVGGRALGAPGWEVQVAAVVDTSVPFLTDDARLWGAPRLPSCGVDLPRAALGDLRSGDPAAVPVLLGLGPGLTPLGDDVLCGWLAAAAAVRSPLASRVSEEVARLAPSRTTLLSATLLACAARGESVPEVRSVLAALGRQDEAHLARALASLLELGSSSGAGLTLGLALALTGAPVEAGVAV